jgi:hypothetical protein
MVHLKPKRWLALLQSAEWLLHNEARRLIPPSQQANDCYKQNPIATLLILLIINMGLHVQHLVA